MGVHPYQIKAVPSFWCIRIHDNACKYHNAFLLLYFDSILVLWYCLYGSSSSAYSRFSFRRIKIHYYVSVIHSYTPFIHTPVFSTVYPSTTYAMTQTCACTPYSSNRLYFGETISRKCGDMAYKEFSIKFGICNCTEGRASPIQNVLRPTLTVYRVDIRKCGM